MAVIRNTTRDTAGRDFTIEPPVSQEVAKPKGVELLEGLLGNDKRMLAPQQRADVPERIVKDQKKFTKTINSDVKEPGWFASLRLRHAVIFFSFFFVVLLPAAFAGFYMLFVASDQYHSSASFSVRSIEAKAPGDLLGIFTQASTGDTVSDSFILIDFIRSERMLAEAEKNFDLGAIFAPRGMDYFYGMAPGLPVENRLKYWRKMVDVNFDHASGIMQLEVKAFNPQDSQAIAKFIIDQSDKLINDLSSSAREGVLKSAEDEMHRAEQRLAKARVAIREYRDVAQEVDPVEGAKLAAQLIGGLEMQLAQMTADLNTARAQMGDDTPRIRVLKARIASVESQLNAERQRLGSGSAAGVAGDGSPDVAGRIQKFEALETERDFAERAYTASLGGLEKARADAGNRQRYLAVFNDPTLSQMAQYPARIVNSILVLLGLLFAWAVMVMSYYNIRDRA